jgi:glycosyltransferase involved in cell wall biosynthesis
MIGRVRSVVLYSVDFVPRRFKNSFFNRLYHAIDAFAIRRADILWTVSQEIADARAKRDGRRSTIPSLVVPVGANFDRIARVPLSQADRTRLVFLGHLLEKQGVQIVIGALPKVRLKVPSVTLSVIGDGPFLQSLREFAQLAGVTHAVTFTGAIADHRDVESILARGALALAPYVPDPFSFTNYADSGKVRTYLACGLPILMTSVPPIATLLAKRGAARLVDYTVNDVADAIIECLTDVSWLESARAAAVELGSEYDWTRIFTDAWRTTRPLVGRAWSS